MRLDLLITVRGLVKSREIAKAAISNNRVFVNGKCISKPSAEVSDNAEIEIRGEIQKFVSRGGNKLERALDYFDIDVKEKICLDLGASTGGFTDCLLQHGAKLVFAVDVGHDQLDKSLRGDSRVVSIEGVNAREINRGLIGVVPDLATVDLSFISLALILPALREVLPDNGEAVCLIKPQFEAGKGNVGKKGIVRDEKTHIRVMEEFIQNAHVNGFAVRGIMLSPISGGDGNIEFLAHLAGDGGKQINVRDTVKAARNDANEKDEQA